MSEFSTPSNKLRFIVCLSLLILSSISGCNSEKPSEVVTDEPVVEELVAEAPITEEPIAEEPIAEEPIAEEPIAEEPIAEEPIAEEPIAEEPVAEEPIAEEPIAEEPVAEETVTEETVTEEPSTEEPSTEETAETVVKNLANEQAVEQKIIVNDKAIQDTAGQDAVTYEAGKNDSSLEQTMQAKDDSAFNWFEKFKTTATDEELYRFLYAMPKGGDLHNHMSGSALIEWFYELALEQEANGYIYYTRVKFENCKPLDSERSTLLLINLQESNYQNLDSCEKSEYKRLQDLNNSEKMAWLNSLRLDKPNEGREEFFQKHWQRMNDIYSNPYISAENLVKNMQAFANEGLIYMEPQIGVFGYQKPDGSYYEPEEVADLYRQRLQQKDAKDTGVTVRLQLSLLRYLPNAEEILEVLYKFIHENTDLFVAVNMVGREDNDKGYPLRFLETLRGLRKQYHSVKLSIHAGEVDEPNYHVRDTLLLGADRIGHGVNLITDPETMLLMRHGPYMVEINLISNLLLEYIEDYSQHPFPEYLRTGIPVALSTDDRGMWDSNMTDEFFVAVKEFNLSWDEVTRLSYNSLFYSFAPEDIKMQMIESFQRSIRDFEDKMQGDSLAALSNKAQTYGFTCRQYKLCDLQ
ncbi:MAG: hypothetical protein KTR16_08485 [Acidiferrobacterales bacterium]|nr:hypothetical protein [Acidiferrobacterales bacterium]